jgi:DNA polymerase-3 subunit chi
MASPRVEFYVVPDGGDADRVACRLAEKAFSRGLSVFVRAASPEHARHLDELLWTYRGASFVPHALADEDQGSNPVLLGVDPAAREAGLLINLGDQAPVHPDYFQRIAEVVGPGEAPRRSGRQRFRYYRDQLGLEPATHRLRS